MQLSFSKYSGCGNDFIVTDGRQNTHFTPTAEHVRQLCHRQQGIGADGMLILQTSDKADFGMRIFNADGSEAEMCGNGIRCLAQFIHELHPGMHACSIASMHRVHQVHVQGDQVKVSMGEPAHIQWDLALPLGKETATVHHMDTGVPHAVEFVDDIYDLDFDLRGASVRRHALFAPQGTNYNAVQRNADKSLAIRTYERGVGETLACATGATAAALAAAAKHGLRSPICVQTKSNEVLAISFDLVGAEMKNICMQGPARKIYQGTVDMAFLPPSHKGGRAEYKPSPHL